MRNIDQSDFETANIEFIEFWMQDPFINTAEHPNATSHQEVNYILTWAIFLKTFSKTEGDFMKTDCRHPTAPSQMDTFFQLGKGATKPNTGDQCFQQ